MGAGDGGLVLGRLQAALTFMTALEQVSDAKVELLNLVEVVGTEVTGVKNGNELGIKQKRRIGTKIGGDFLSLVLKNQRTGGLKRVVMRKRQVNCLIKRDERRGLSLNGGRKQQASQSCQDDDPEVRWTHKTQI